MKPTNTTAPPPAGTPARAASALLLAAAGALLAQAPTAAHAQGTTFTEGSAPGGDFGNTFALKTTLTLGTRIVNGDILRIGGILISSSDPDFFTFTGLAGSTPYTLSISAGDSFDGYSATFQAYNDTGAAIGTSAAYIATDAPGTLRVISGTIPISGILTIGVNPQTVPFVEGGNPVYTTTLTAADVPEPATTSLIALAAALAVLTARRHRKPTDTVAAE